MLKLEFIERFYWYAMLIFIDSIKQYNLLKITTTTSTFVKRDTLSGIKWNQNWSIWMALEKGDLLVENSTLIYVYTSSQDCLQRDTLEYHQTMNVNCGNWDKNLGNRSRQSTNFHSLMGPWDEREHPWRKLFQSSPSGGLPVFLHWLALPGTHRPCLCSSSQHTCKIQLSLPFHHSWKLTHSQEPKCRPLARIAFRHGPWHWGEPRSTPPSLPAPPCPPPPSSLHPSGLTGHQQTQLFPACWEHRWHRALGQASHHQAFQSFHPPGAAGNQRWLLVERQFSFDSPPTPLRCSRCKMQFWRWSTSPAPQIFFLFPTVANLTFPGLARHLPSSAAQVYPGEQSLSSWHRSKDSNGDNAGSGSSAPSSSIV